MIIFTLYYSDNNYIYDRGKLPTNFDKIIDYNSIISKLIKKDNLKEPPSKLVVSLAIYKELKNIFEDKNIIDSKNFYNVLYIIKHLNIEVLKSINIVLRDLRKIYEKEYKILLLCKKDHIIEDFKDYAEIYLIGDDEEKNKR